MSITFTERVVELDTQTQTKRIKPTSLKTATFFDGIFFVVGRTHTGGRFYSETVNSYNEVYHIFKLYKDMIAYFGGGEVQIFCIHDDGYDVVEFSKI